VKGGEKKMDKEQKRRMRGKSQRSVEEQKIKLSARGGNVFFFTTKK
jgi:hypothetical protein